MQEPHLNPPNGVIHVSIHMEPRKQVICREMLLEEPTPLGVKLLEGGGGVAKGKTLGTLTKSQIPHATGGHMNNVKKDRAPVGSATGSVLDGRPCGFCVR